MTIVLTLAALLALAAVLVTGITYTLFCYELANQPHPFFAKACQDSPGTCLGRGLITSFTSQIILGLTYPLGLCIRTRPRTAPRPGQPVVVCLHGLYHNASAFLGLWPVLRRAGFRNILYLPYSSFARDFETTTQNLLARLRQAAPPDSPLLFVGHSLGGLFTRRLLAEPDIAGRTLAAVTLGSPHQGSKLAALAIGRLGRQLMPARGLPAALDALPDPPGLPLLALVSPVDNMVLPLSGLEIHRPGWVMEIVPPMSHVSMLYHPAATRRVADFLREATDRAGQATQS